MYKVMFSKEYAKILDENMMIMVRVKECSINYIFGLFIFKIFVTSIFTIKRSSNLILKTLKKKDMSSKEYTLKFFIG